MLLKNNRFTPLFGIFLNLGLAGLALQLHQSFGLKFLSPMIIAIACGIFLRNVIGIAPIFALGTRFCLKRILKLAIILMGLRLSFDELQQVGLSGFMLVSLTLLSTFSFTLWLGYILKIKPQLVYLIAAGTSICGASAVVATNAVVEGADEDMVYAVTLVTAFGTTAMLLYPLLGPLLQLSPESFGLWCGTSIHEVAQVVAAAFQNSSTSGEFATISKLTRVLFLLPVMLILGRLPIFSSQVEVLKISDSSDTLIASKKKNIKNSLPIPWFVILFACMILLNSFHVFSDSAKVGIIQINQIFLAMSLAAMGLETDLSKLLSTGLKPFYLAAMSSIFLSLLSLALIKILDFS